mmetsp:Transcript_13992/g.41723  ORF Transcript_13992/g.41723 Transcript_13992/m.41723 type:complete len:161 (-) Transcript_13992:208-690(-)
MEESLKDAAKETLAKGAEAVAAVEEASSAVGETLDAAAATTSAAVSAAATAAASAAAEAGEAAEVLEPAWELELFGYTLSYDSVASIFPEELDAQVLLFLGVVAFLLLVAIAVAWRCLGEPISDLYAKEKESRGAPPSAKDSKARREIPGLDLGKTRHER